MKFILSNAKRITTNRSNNFSAILLLGASFVALSIFLEHLIGAFLSFFVENVKVKVKLKLNVEEDRQ
jgi:hypothetical protein